MQKKNVVRGALGAAIAVVGLSACSNVKQAVGSIVSPAPADPRVALMEAIPVSPAGAEPEDASAGKVWKKALDARGLRIVVSTRDRALWLLSDTTTLFRAPVAVGTSETLEYGGRTWDFTTPIGVRKVLGRATTPLWVPPDWHYLERAVDQNLEVVRLKPGSKITLSDGTRIEVRGDQVGRVNQYGNFWPFRPGAEIVFDGKIFIPPFGTEQRRVPEILGTHKLELGDGYLIHGTNEEGSIGEAVSHGCVRMYNEDVAWLFDQVPNGTPVYIY